MRFGKRERSISEARDSLLPVITLHPPLCSVLRTTPGPGTQHYPIVNKSTSLARDRDLSGPARIIISCAFPKSVSLPVSGSNDLSFPLIQEASWSSRKLRQSRCSWQDCTPGQFHQEDIWLFDFKYSSEDLKLGISKYTLVTELGAKKK